MTRRILFALCAFVFAAVPAAAQTPHPCDAPAVAVGRLANTTQAHAQFCVPASNNIDAVTVYRDDQPTNLTTLTRVTPETNAAGLALYDVLLGTIPNGTYVYQVSAWNKTVEGAAQEGPRSDPFSLTVVDQTPPPAKPVIVRIGG